MIACGALLLLCAVGSVFGAAVLDAPGFDDSNCVDETGSSGVFEDTEYYPNNKCWRIRVPENHSVRLTLASADFVASDCSRAFLNITEVATSTEHTLCNSEADVITASSDVIVRFRVKRPSYQPYSFKLSYDILASKQRRDTAELDAGKACVNVTDLSGVVDFSDYFYGTPRTRCWRVIVPENHVARLNLTSVNFRTTDCSGALVDISDLNGMEQTKCGVDGNVFTAYGDVFVTLRVKRGSYLPYGFRVTYDIEPAVHDNMCVVKEDHSGVLEDTEYYPNSKCWRIRVPENHSVRLTLASADFVASDCSRAFLNITEVVASKEHSLCNSEADVITTSSDVIVRFRVKRPSFQPYSFKLNYDIRPNSLKD